MPKAKGNYCNVQGCFNRSEDDSENRRHYYRLPAVITHQGKETEQLSSERRRLWLAKLNQNMAGKNLDNVRICSDHFIHHKKAELYEKDHPNWLPTINMSTKLKATPDVKSSPNKRRHRRRVDRAAKTAAADALMELSGVREATTEPANSDNDCDTGIEVQTEIDDQLFSAMQEELQNLRTDNVKLVKRVSNATAKFTIVDFDGDDEKVKYFTGLPTFTILLSLFNFLESSLPTKQSLDKFQILIMCLMRLRLYLPLQLLAYQFNVSMSSVSRYLSETIDEMYMQMKSLVNWPERDELRETMPMQFRKNFGTKIAIIIDCFEIFIERPSNMLARAETWSSYKHHNTAKYLIGITPQGSVSFISLGFGGRVSDKHITEHCTFLSHVLPGDIIMADRGFDISGTLGSVCAEVRIPAFTKGKNQLSPLDVESTRKLASNRIHVERVNGIVRQKYTILSSTVSCELLLRKEGEDVTQLDKIVRICCALVNLCPSVVDFN